MGQFKNLSGQSIGIFNILDKNEDKSNSKRIYWNCICEICKERSIVRSDSLRVLSSCKNCRKNSLVGKTFGELVVTHREYSEQGRMDRWLCKCSCGGESVVRTADLKSGHTSSCGKCLPNKMIGAKIGRLTIKSIEENISGKGKGTYVICDCECGSKNIAIKSTLIGKHTNSCGCIIKEQVGDKVWNYKGGITPIHNYGRTVIASWVRDSFKNVGYKCQISGDSKNLVVHHIYPYSLILKETLLELNTSTSKLIIELNDSGKLEDFKTRLLKNHYKYGLGFVLTRDLHEEFHSAFGKGENGKPPSRKELLEFIKSKKK